jgi:hypothetical protein
VSARRSIAASGSLNWLCIPGPLGAGWAENAIAPLPVRIRQSIEKTEKTAIRILRNSGFAPKARGRGRQAEGELSQRDLSNPLQGRDFLNLNPKTVAWPQDVRR